MRRPPDARLGGAGRGGAELSGDPVNAVRRETLMGFGADHGGAAESASCEHKWRRWWADPLTRYYGTVCAACAHTGTLTYDKAMPEPTAEEWTVMRAIVAARPKPPPEPRKVRFGRWRREMVSRARCRAASVIAGFDVS